MMKELFVNYELWLLWFFDRRSLATQDCRVAFVDVSSGVAEGRRGFSAFNTAEASNIRISVPSVHVWMSSTMAYHGYQTHTADTDIHDVRSSGPNVFVLAIGINVSTSYLPYALSSDLATRIVDPPVL